MLTASDIEQRRAELRLNADRQFADDAKSVMGMPAGQRLLARIIYDELDRPLVGPTENVTLVNAAKADFVRTLERELQAASPEAFRQMHDERIKTQNHEAATLRALTVPKTSER